MRMSMRGFTRLTNALATKVENLDHYNVRIHKTLRCTPAMEAGVAKRLWTVADIVALLERDEAQRAA